MHLPLRRTLVGLLFLAAFGAACSAKELPYPGGIMLAIQTDLAVPKDFSAVGLYISSDGKPIFGDTREVAPKGEVKFPATIAILADENRPRAVVKIRAVAFKANGDVRVLRDIITTIPKGRTALLRVPLAWINDGSGSGNRSQLISSASLRPRNGTNDGFERLTSACPDGQTFLEGECGDAKVDGDALPDYVAKDVFGGGDAQGNGGRCFDVAKCFATTAAVAVKLDTNACTATLADGPADDPNLSVAMVLPASADTGECFDGRCVVPVDKGTWKPRGNAIELPRAFCKKVVDAKATGVVTSRACPTKDATAPLCGPAGAVTASVPAMPVDGGGVTPGTEDPDFEVPFVARRIEPMLADVAIDAENVYLARAKPDMPPGVLRIKKAYLTSGTAPEGFQVIHAYPQGQEMRAKIALSPGAIAQNVLARTQTGLVVTCTAASQGACPDITFQGLQARNAIAAGSAEGYVYGLSASTEALYSVAYGDGFIEARATLPAGKATAMAVSNGTILLGTDEGALYKCAVPCTSQGQVMTLRAKPATPAAISAIAVSDKIPNKVFFIQLPLGGPAGGGVYEIGLDGTGEFQYATAMELSGSVEPPGALAVDAQFVYWGGGFVDPRDNTPKSALLRRSHVTRGTTIALAETVHQGIDALTAVAVDDTHVFWTYYRNDRSLLIAKKKRAF